MRAGNPRDENCIAIAAVFTPGSTNPDPTEGTLHSHSDWSRSPSCLWDPGCAAHDIRGCEGQQSSQLCPTLAHREVTLAKISGLG